MSWPSCASAAEVISELAMKAMLAQVENLNWVIEIGSTTRSAFERLKVYRKCSKQLCDPSVALEHPQSRTHGSPNVDVIVLVHAQKICPKKEISRTLSESRLTALSLIPSTCSIRLNWHSAFQPSDQREFPFPHGLHFD